MTRWVLLWTVLGACSAWADVPPPPVRPDLSCVGRSEGAACGRGGRCEKRLVRRPDFSAGGVPTWGTVEVMICSGSSAIDAPAVLPALAWAALLAALGLGARLHRSRSPAR